MSVKQGVKISRNQAIGTDVVAPADSGAIPSKIMTGGRAVLYIDDTPIGSFSNIAIANRQEKVPAYVLGRYAPVENTPTAQDPVSLTLTGYRVFGKGPFKNGVTLVRGLIAEGTFTVRVFDRQNFDINRPMAVIRECSVTSWSTGFAARSQSDLRLEIIGLSWEDEDSGDNSEGKSPL